MFAPNCNCIHQWQQSSSEEQFQFYSKIRKLQVKMSSYSFKKDRRDTYMQIDGN